MILGSDLREDHGTRARFFVRRTTHEGTLNSSSRHLFPVSVHTLVNRITCFLFVNYEFLVIKKSIKFLSKVLNASTLVCLRGKRYQHMNALSLCLIIITLLLHFCSYSLSFFSVSTLSQLIEAQT